jgi:hypothetical protein
MDFSKAVVGALTLPTFKGNSDTKISSNSIDGN